MTKETNRCSRISNDLHELYLASVQDPVGDIQRVSKIYKDIFKKPATSFREDFSGTFALSCCFVQSSPENRAIAIDLDQEALDYGKKNYLANLSEDEQSRVEVLLQNSISTTAKVDMACAFNFSYCLLHKRSELLDYFRHVYNSLNNDGMLILDLFGGSESEIPEVQERYIDNCEYLAPFTFEFVREDFNAVNRHANYTINFKYDEGTEHNAAFRYHFRMWSINEIRDCMQEVGFTKSLVFWEDFDEEGFGNGEFYPSEQEENTYNWNAYVVGVK